MLLLFQVGRSPAATKSKLDPAREVLVVVNLDDIGVHQDQTDASFAAIRKGMAKTGTIMVPGPDFQRTAGLVKANPDLHFGIHITLTNEWRSPVSGCVQRFLLDRGRGQRSLVGLENLRELSGGPWTGAPPSLHPHGLRHARDAADHVRRGHQGPGLQDLDGGGDRGLRRQVGD